MEFVRLLLFILLFTSKALKMEGNVPSVFNALINLII